MDLFNNFAGEFIDDLQKINSGNLNKRCPIIYTVLNASDKINYVELRNLAERNLDNNLKEELSKFLDAWSKKDELTNKILDTFKKFDPKFNRIYLFENDKAYLDINEEPEIEKFIQTRFEKLVYSSYDYFCPSGWRRYSLKIDDFDSKFKNWPVAYHGTKSENLINILTEGFRISKQGVCFGEGIYFSPSIEYCGHWRYARPKKSKTRQFYIQAVFQCRLRPGSFTVNRETMILDDKKESKSKDPNIDTNKIIDVKFSNKELEWTISSKSMENLKKENKEAFIIYGIMVRITKEHPKNLKINRWWDYYYDIPKYFDVESDSSLSLISLRQNS